MAAEPGTVSPVFATTMPARYTFAGGSWEVDKTLPLAPNEHILENGSVWLRWGIILQRVGSVRLTEPRLVVLGHYAFQADRVVEIPAGALESVESSVLGWTRVTFRTESGPRSLDVKPLAISPTFSASLQAWLVRTHLRST